MKKLMLFAVSLVCAAVSAYAQQPSTGAAEAAVPIEEYVPKVIIEGKWGTGPGEFGYDGFRPEGASPEDFYPMSPSFSPDDFIHPRSLAVDSKGNVYVLDTANQRIQKFSGEGKYLLSLKVDSWSGYKLREDGGDGYVYSLLGINIVIDAKDDLYYYLKRTRDGKESGEVWQFRNDKLVKKTTVPVGGSISQGQGLVRQDEDDSIWILNAKNPVTSGYKNYEVKEGKSFSGRQRIERYKKIRAKEKSKPQKYRVYMEVFSGGVRVFKE